LSFSVAEIAPNFEQKIKHHPMKKLLLFFALLSSFGAISQNRIKLSTDGKSVIFNTGYSQATLLVSDNTVKTQAVAAKNSVTILAANFSLEIKISPTDSLFGSLLGSKSLIAVQTEIQGKFGISSGGSTSVVSGTIAVSNLPPDPSTGAKQDLGITALNSINTKTPTLVGGRTPVNIGTDGTVTISNNITGFATEATANSLFKAGQSIGNTSFGISGTLPSFASTPTFNVGTIAGISTEATLLALKNQVDALKTVADNIKLKTDNLDVPTSSRTKPLDVQKTDGSATIQPISATALPLPPGASTEAKQDLAKIALDLLHTDLVSATPTGTNTIGNVNQSQSTAGFSKLTDGTNDVSIKAASTASTATDKALVIDIRPTTASFGANTPTVTAITTAGNTITTANCIKILIENQSLNTNATVTYGGQVFTVGFKGNSAGYSNYYAFDACYDTASRKYSPFATLVVDAAASNIFLTKIFAQ